MAKTANLYVRIEPELKEQAEDILNSLGISVSNAINMFYKQIVLQRGIPFELKMPQSRMLDLTKMTAQEFDEEMERAYQDMQAGRGIPAKQAFEEIRMRHGL